MENPYRIEAPATDQSAWLWPYQALLAQFGPQHWWPGGSPFEVMVGAVLTQNTAWPQVEQAIAALKSADALSPRALLALPTPALAALIRPAGTYQIKARRLQALCAFLDREGVSVTPDRLAASLPLREARQALLTVHGIGEETADAILLYALNRPSFVVDAYTRRIFGRLGLLRGDESYAEIQHRFETALPRDTVLYNDYHAQIVALGKRHCRPRPRCRDCPLLARCPSAR